MGSEALIDEANLDDRFRYSFVAIPGYLYRSRYALPLLGAGASPQTHQFPADASDWLPVSITLTEKCHSRDIQPQHFVERLGLLCVIAGASAVVSPTEPFHDLQQACWGIVPGAPVRFGGGYLKPLMLFERSPLRLVIRIHRQTPPYGSLRRCVQVVHFWRKRSALGGDLFPAAAQAAIDAGQWRDRPWGIFDVE
jgi:hypothetical protein